MADDNWTRNVICRYFKNGLCREGENCRYRHPDQSDQDQSDSDSLPISTVMTCRFFKLGKCKYGNRCRFGHSTNGRNDRKKEREESNNDIGSSSSSIPSSSSACSSSSIQETDQQDKKWICKPEEWANAPEFVPSFILPGAVEISEEEMEIRDIPSSYARAVSSSGKTLNPASEPLCPYAEANGVCRNIDCVYLHGDICEFCARAALHPYNEELRLKHTNACIKQHEVDMELSFAIQRSRDKTCGVCFEIVMEKSSREQKFGILPNCNHCFCLSCIMKWRQAKQFDNKIIRSCPECRVASDFVCPSTYWVDTKEEKEKLIVEYKGALSLKDCKHFNKGQGKCPFGNKCFYLHALPDGTKTDVGPPARPASNADADLDFLQQVILWNFVEERDDRLTIYMDDNDEVVVSFLIP